MNIKLLTVITVILVSANLYCQTDTSVNITDQQGRKQGRWITKYPNGNIRYEGVFLNDHPAGELKRYYDDQTINSVMIFSDDGKEARATIYFPDGSVAASGKYLNRMKEGKWKFFSSSVPGYLLNEEEYSKSLRNGLSIKFYADSTIAEKALYKNDKKEGEWIQCGTKMASRKSEDPIKITSGKANGLFTMKTGLQDMN
jgi:antitoxin component YwqK of YwqJK toxin-antitoxin module